jgi:prepilin-type N-terminal cleavage/methylation domain-containing protein/prepilin-type processing-associated H-X9-DG protein
MYERKGFTLIELLTVISLICLLMAILLPYLQGARANARAGVCQSNLRQWGLVYKMYTDECDGRLPRDYGEFAWYYPIRGYYSKEVKILLCPTTKKAADPDGTDSGPPFGGTFLAWGRFEPPGARPAWDTCGSYGLNQWAYKPGKKEHTNKDDDDKGKVVVVGHGRRARIPRISNSAPEDPNEIKDTNPYWDTAYAHNSNNIPLVFDCSWLYAHFVEDAAPPIKNAGLAINFFGFANPVCIDRHRKGINMVFFDWSVRKVGLKELWTLKWHRQYNTAGPWTRAGGVRPESWPKWMRNCKDY